MSQLAVVMRRVLIRMFKPLVKILLRHHVPYKAAADALRYAYVDVAMNEFGIDGKSTKSRAAVITGLSRIEVDAQLKQGADVDLSAGVLRHHRAARVLTGWATDPDYRDADGRPAAVALNGSGLSLTALTERYAGGTTVKAVLDELLRVAAVARLEDGRYGLLKPSFVPEGDETQLQRLEILGMSGHDLLSTIDHNLTPGQADLRFQRFVEQTELPLRHVAAARQLIRAEGIALTEKVNAALAALARDRLDEEPLCDRIGIGLYYYQSDPPSTETRSLL